MGSNDRQLCEPCSLLVGASRHTQGHPQLSYEDGKMCSSMMGPADESYYRCRTCGQHWLRETGSYGMGWQRMP
jgi:hypothetical protein